MGNKISEIPKFEENHKTIYHKYHSKQDCVGKHCVHNVWCKKTNCIGTVCNTRITICSDCTRNQIKCPNCRTSINTTSFLDRICDSNNNPKLEDTHICKDHEVELVVGHKYHNGYGYSFGQTFTRCKIHYQNKCYDCGKYGLGSPTCYDCQVKYFRLTFPVRICKCCGHDHIQGKLCNESMISNGTVHGQYQTFTTEVETKCTCRL